MFLPRAAVFFCAALTPCAAQSPPNVILISVDTLRADHVGVYGYHRAQTPNIDALADHGTVFRDISAQIPLTLPSHYSLFTSTYPFETKVEGNAQQVPAKPETVAKILHDRGYATAGFIGAVYLEHELGVDQGFDFYDSPFRFEAFSSLSGSMFFGDRSSNPMQARSRRDGALVVRAALQWLHENRSKPSFAFIHFFDLHQPYRLAGYDAELEYVDRLIGTLRETLSRDGLWDRSLIIFLSDHGESLGDHGEQTHGYFIYQSTLHVPLIIHWPAGVPESIASPVQAAGLIDVAPTILDSLHIPAPASFAGRSLLANNPSPVYSESTYSRDAFGWSALRSLRLGKYKYIAAPHPELYDLEADPHERNNVITAHPNEARGLQSRLAAMLVSSAVSASPAAPSPEKMAALKSLGYLAPSSRPALDTSGADPKDRLPEYDLYEDAQHELLSGRNSAAITILRRILVQDPKNTLARRDLGIAYVAAGDYTKARENLKQVADAAPADFVAHFELGLADEHLGNLAEARDQLETACRIAPQSGGCRRELEAVRKKQ